MVSVASYLRRYGFPGTVVAIAIAVMLFSCRPADFNNATGSWKIYHNSRYGFEFPYPVNWVALNPPANRDGQAFCHPEHRSVEVRGWAGYQLSADMAQKQNHSSLASTQALKQNFITQQGSSGELQVDIGRDISSMTLTLKQGTLLYSWQGKSPSQEFASYYQFFYYIASQYHLPERSR